MEFKELIPRSSESDIYARHEVRKWFGFPEKRIVSDWVWCTPGRRTRTKSAPSLRDLSDDLRLSDEDDGDQGYGSMGPTIWDRDGFEVLVLPQTPRKPAIPKSRWQRSHHFIDEIQAVVPGPRRPEVTPRRVGGGRRKASPNLDAAQMHEAKRRRVGESRNEAQQKRQAAMLRSQEEGRATFAQKKDTQDQPDPFRRPASADAILSMSSLRLPPTTRREPSPASPGCSTLTHEMHVVPPESPASPAFSVASSCVSSASLASTSDHSVVEFKVTDNMKAHVVFDLNEIVEKKKAQIAKKKEAAKLDDVAFAIKETRKAGFRVMNRSAAGKDLSHWCPICNTKQSKLVDHIKKPPKTGKCGEAHKNVDAVRALNFLKAQNSRGMRGPFFVPSIVDQLLEANGDRRKMENIIGNVLSNVGVGHAKTESDAMLVYDMSRCFQRDWEKPEDRLNELLQEDDVVDDDDDAAAS